MSAARQIFEAQVEEAKRKLREQAEAEALQRMTGGGVPLDLPGRSVAAPPVIEPPAMELPTRQVNVDVGEPPPSNVIEFPTRKRIVSPQTAPEVPVDLPTYRPVGLDTRTGAINEAPTTVDSEGYASDTFLPTRPHLAHPKGTVEYQDKLVTDLESMPAEKMSRKGGALYGFLRGLATGGLVGGGIGALTGAIAPGRTAELKHRDQIAKASGKLDTAIEREGKLSVIDERRRHPEKEMAAALRAEREKRIANLMTMHGRAGHYNPDDPSDKASQVIKAQAEALGVADQLIPYTGGDKVPPHLVVDDTVYERGPNGDWRPAEGLPRRQMVDVPGYGKMTPAQARQADATEGERADRRSERQSETEAQRSAAQQNAAEAERAASDHLGKRRQADEEVSRLQGLLRGLGTVSPDDPQRIEIEDQIKTWRTESAYRQREADNAFADARKAKGEAQRYNRSTSQSLPTRGGRKSKTYTVNTSKYGLP
jgi:hypothetical protein